MAIDKLSEDQKENARIAEIKIRNEALEERLDKMINRVNDLTKIINSNQLNKNFYSISEVSKMAGFNRRTVKKDINENRLKVVHRGSREFVSKEEAKNYLKPE